MRRHLMFPTIAAALIAAAPAARGAVASKVTSLEAPASGGTVIIHASALPEFTVFKLSGPPRVVIDLNGADVTPAARPLEVHHGAIAAVSAAQFDEAATRVRPIVATLEGDHKHQATPTETDLLVT